MFSISEIYSFGSFVFRPSHIFDSNIPAEIVFILIFFFDSSVERDFDRLICEIFDEEYNDKYDEPVIDEIVPINTMDASVL